MRVKLAIVKIVVFTASAGLPLAGQQWQPVGPEGGSVRSLTLDPRNPDRIFLGTSAGRIYLSADGGGSWSRYAHLGNSSEMVLDHIVIDPVEPANIYVAAWNAQAPNADGDLFRSRDGGQTWTAIPELHGKSIRALAMAASNPKVLAAGALDGVFLTRDAGQTWQRISPEKHAELKNVESVAIDPVNPDVVYAGTWHLPWKTDDGGKNWHSIKKGVIDDSDVFSIVVDSAAPANVFISACSGIYRSDSAGELFRKIQGIPYSARRTRSLRIDPSNHEIVYAGTTEGLWKSADGGLSWRRMTRANVIINDVVIDPRRPEHLLLATDRGGVLASNDGGASFTASNRGFTHRQVAAVAVDRADGSVIFAGLLNDKEFGGVYVSRDRGQSWQQTSDGLDGRDVLVLEQAANRTWVAGTDRGIFLLRPNSSRWVPVNRLMGNDARAGEIKTRVTGLEVRGEKWLAATGLGLLISSDSGVTWRKLELPGIDTAIGVAAADRMRLVAGHNAIVVSANAGESWLAPIPFHAGSVINSAAVESSGNLWVAAPEGVFLSSDMGDSWKRMNLLRISNIAGIQVDQANQRILVTSAASTTVFESRDDGRTWSPINSGWLLRGVSSAEGRLLGTTPFDGVVIQPENSVSMR
jgi:photosystem II stability/assembly factor-like uncharacterized protein